MSHRQADQTPTRSTSTVPQMNSNGGSTQQPQPQQLVQITEQELKQVWDQVPSLNISPEAWLTRAKRLDFSVHAEDRDYVQKHLTKHQQQIQPLMTRVEQAVIDHLGLEWTLSQTQRRSVDVFIRAMFQRSIRELEAVAGRPQPQIQNHVDILPIQFQFVKAALRRAEEVIRPKKNDPNPSRTVILVTVTAMRWQREIFEQWIEDLQSPPADRAARANTQPLNERSRRRGPGRPEGALSVKKAAKATKASSPETQAQSSPVHETRQVATSRTPQAPTRNNCSSPYENLGTVRSAPVSAFRRPGTQQQANYVQRQQFQTPERQIIPENMYADSPGLTTLSSPFSPPGHPSRH